MAEEKKSKKKKVSNKFLSKYKGRGYRKCRFCGSARGLVRRYGLNICRRCFREIGEEIGFRKY
ncbi:30S ribosomal protein S14 [Candidatus Micrarchaeota archaeon]|nr:MAG: 30S ribosomal protein S14 [Candidatus Micrarchaeota archaeon]